ncbi:MAG: hypothetical protein IKD71_04540, partial [Solobacterium sp.]|nr:hypothetical protein [Solobacterium sp.]
PELASEWHPTKNGTLTPEMLTLGSGIEVWWRCKKGHEYKARISRRVRGDGCPYCSGHKVEKGFNDLATLNPELAKEWHPTKNGSLTPEMVAPNSNKKVWWQCKNGHEWQAYISNRNRGNKCPYCTHSIKRAVVCVETNITYKSIADASKSLNVSRVGISACCSGKQNTAGGYHWKYKETE